jgi:regulatory protein SWI5
MTPATTPFRRVSELAATYHQNVHVSPTKNATIMHTPQSSYMQRAKSLQGVTGSTFTQPQVDVPSPPNTAPVDFDAFDMINRQESDFESSEFQPLPKSESFHTPNREEQYHSQPSSASVSFQSSPELAFMPLPGESPGRNPKVPIAPATPSRASAKKTASLASCSSPSKPKLSPRVASIDNLKLDSRVDASIADTGITIEEIATYISGPDPEDGKWVCLHPGCDRRFGRKENIKSHIQTHLGDRQYKCNHCDKCFVRGHDLKRHAKIHTGDKPYECLCGNVFARHDALTRHRQRGMCIGGYRGVVRKTTKRGRPPKKSRPDMEGRQDKAARTREKVAVARSIASSVSGSESSCGSPHTEVFENMSMRGSSPLEDIAVYESHKYCLPSDVFTFTPPASPEYSTGNPSPVRSQRSYTPCTDDGALCRSPSKQALEQIPEEMSDLPPLPEAHGCFEPETTIHPTANTLSSSPTAPTLTGSSAESDMDIFISQDASSFDNSHLSSFNESGMSSFSDYGTGTNFCGDMDFFPGKAVPSSLNDDFLVEFEDDPDDVFFK